MIENDPFKVDHKDHIALLTINRPEKRNAMGFRFFEVLARHFAEFDSNPDITANFNAQTVTLSPAENNGYQKYGEKRYQKEGDSQTDYSVKICEDLLDDYGLALVPGAAFGAPNTARMSLVLEKAPFVEAMELLSRFLVEEVSA